MRRVLRETAVARACATAVLLISAAAQAAIVTLGDVNPDPSSGTVSGTLGVGNTAAGSVAVNGGSLLSVDRMWIAGGAGSSGLVALSGTGSRLDIHWGFDRHNLDIGAAGAGRLQIEAGSFVQYGDSSASCVLTCRTFVSNAAGSAGTLNVAGSGSTFNTAGTIYVGHASVFTTAADGFNFGRPGASSTGEVNVTSGGMVNATQLQVGAAGGGMGRTGSERTFGQIIVDGVGSVINLVRDALRTGDAAPLAIGTGGNGSGTVTVRNGGGIRIDGSTAPLNYNGINLGGGDGSSAGRLVVDGAGSRVHLTGGQGFINVGSVAGAHGALEITNGGLVDGSGAAGLRYVAVGRRGATGTLLVDGADAAGNASTLRLSGRDPVSGFGAFLSIGRTDTAASTGTASVLRGGRIDIDTRADILTLGNGQPGFQVGEGEGSSGRLDVRGRNAANGAASTVHLRTGTGVANWVAIGRDGGNGTLNIADGGRLLMESQRISAAGATYAPGEAQSLGIGVRYNGGTSATHGLVSVTGAGSEIVLSGASDSAVRVGQGSNANGVLSVSSGGSVRALGLQIGDHGANGQVMLSGGGIHLSGTMQGGPAPGLGAYATVGRGGGTGLLSLNSRSVMTIDSSAPFAALHIGGSTTLAGGTGTVSVGGASSITVNGPDARVFVGSTNGTGTLVVHGAGSAVSATGSHAALLIGRDAGSVGTANIGRGASLGATSLIGIAHDGSADTGGVGTLIVNGEAHAARLVNGHQGLLGGAGDIYANVVNHGVIAPGNSPGRLTIHGGFDAADGLIQLEVEQQADGSWLFDELVFGNVLDTMFRATSRIEFHFLGDADPLAFRDSGLFGLGTFFHELDATGGVAPAGLQLLESATPARFSAVSDRYRITRFDFTPIGGVAALEVSGVPLPPSLALVALALVVGSIRTRGARRLKPASLAAA